MFTQNDNTNSSDNEIDYWIYICFLKKKSNL